MISDGECQEGTTWESLLIAGKHKLDNLIIIVDYNKLKHFQNSRMHYHLKIYLKNLKLLIVIVLKSKMAIIFYQFTKFSKKLKIIINQMSLLQIQLKEKG